MDLDSLFCGICYSNYDTNTKIPRILSNCGHTVCLECLCKILKINPNSLASRPTAPRSALRTSNEEDDSSDESVLHVSFNPLPEDESDNSADDDEDSFSMRCPFDKLYISRNLQQHPVNYALMQLLEDKTKAAEGCQIHKQKMRFICLCNKSKVCHDCIIFGDHKGHQTRLLTEIAEEAESKQKKLADSITRYEQHSKDTNQVIEKKQTCLLKGMKQKFGEIRSILDSKEFEVSARINGILRAEQKKIDEDLQINAMLENDLNTKSEEYQQKLKNKEFLSVLEDDISLLKQQVNENLLSKRLTTYAEQLKKIPDFGELFFNSLKPLIPKLDNSVDHIITDNFVKNKKLKTKSSHDTGNHTNWIELDNSLGLRVANKVLVVSTTNNPVSKKLINLEEWNELSKVKLEFVHYNTLTIKENQKTLGFICNWARKIPRFEIVFEPKDFSEAALFDILSVILTSPEKVKHIQICLEKCKVSNQSFTLLFENFMSQMTNLHSLELNLGSTPISDKCLEVFSNKVLKSMPELKSFALDLSDVYGVSDRGVISILVGMETIRSYYLHLQNTDISDDALNYFADNVLPEMQNLKNLTLCLGGTNIGDGSVATVFNKLNHKLHSLIIDVDSTNVTNRSVSAFLQNFSEFSEVLKSLDISFDDTYVTEKYVKKLNKIRKSFTLDQAE